MSLVLIALMGAQQPALHNPERLTWQEETIVAHIPGIYHPHLRLFQESKFVFNTPDKIVVNGIYSRDGQNVVFRPTEVFELNHADLDKLTAEEQPAQKQAEAKIYEKGLTPFSGSFSDDGQSLHIDYGVMGYQLHPFDYGDAALANTVPSDQAFLVGVWSANDPNPERQDSKTRYRWDGIDGLRKFQTEAMGSDGSYLGQLDLHSDNTFRIGGGDTGFWSIQGGKLHLKIQLKDDVYDIAKDPPALLRGGKKIWVRT